MRLVTLSIGFTAALHAGQFDMQSIASDYSQVIIRAQLDEGQVIFQDTLAFTSSNPDLPVHGWSSRQQTHPFFDKASGVSKPTYRDTVEFVVTLRPTQQPITTPTTLFMHFFSNNKRFPQERQFRIMSPADAATSPSPSIQESVPTTKPPLLELPPVVRTGAPTFADSIYEGIRTAVRYIAQIAIQGRAYISHLITTTTSLPIQMLLIFLLGLLMSLTPCIYPMIPITVGLLGTSSAQSVWRNLFLALSYTVGVATTYALFGLSVAFFGTQCGSIICNPFFVLGLVLFLAYCGGSMFGWYEFYIPRFLQPSSRFMKRGSALSVFAFGAASGLIASPCMSPGLALVLTLVASLQQYFLGFLLLFVFGIGSSIPLLVVGTFSSSLHLLPRAGMWMNDVKKFFGLMLFMVCFYYLQIIIPAWIVYGIASLFVFLCGILYSTNFITAHSLARMLWVTLASFILIFTGLYMGYTSIITWYISLAQCTSEHVWLTDYTAGRTQAQQCQKPMLLDFTASWCSLCTTLNKRILSHPQFQTVFEAVVPIKVDGSSATNPQYQKLIAQYHVQGLPTLLLVDPHNEAVLHTWHAELLDKTAYACAQEIGAVIHAKS